jgi:hypothetical protein
VAWKLPDERMFRREAATRTLAVPPGSMRGEFRFRSSNWSGQSGHAIGISTAVTADSFRTSISATDWTS